jgi:hypothetical protein
MGTADGSNHAWFAPNFVCSSTGACMVSGSGIPIAVAYPLQTAWQSVRIAGTIKTSSSQAAMGFIARAFSTPAEAGLQALIINSAGWSPTNGVFLYKVSAGGAYTSLGSYTGTTIAASTSYTFEMVVQSNSQDGADVLVSVYLNSVRVIAYTLTSAEATTYTNTGRSGLASYQVSDDGGSRVTNLTITQATDLPYVHAGTATLSAGTKAVANTSITANSKVRVWNDSASGTVGALSVAITAGTGFTINSTSGSDASTIYYEIVSY